MAFMKIQPTDSLFFRDGKPFNAGSESWSDSSLLPNPSTIWGAMFAVLYDSKKLSSNIEDRKKLQIKNIYLYNEKQTTILVPAPLDIFIDSDENKYISDYEYVNFVSNYPLDVMSFVDTTKDIKPLENYFLEINSLYQHYINGYSKNLILYNFDDVLLNDHKIGIKIDSKTKTAQENYLYRIDLTQFKENWSFLIEYECEVDFPKEGILKLGGEGKIAKYYKVEEIPIGLQSVNILRKEIFKSIINEDYFKVFFKTPVFFENGWRPKQEGLVCANVGKYISIGGWDMETKKPKVMKRYVPAGSVYVFERKGILEFELEDDEAYKGFGAYEILPF